MTGDALTSRRATTLGSGGARGAALAALATLLLTLLATLGATPALANTQSTPQVTRPTEAVAYARIAVARVLTYYYGKTTTSGPIPVLSPCIGDAALIGTTGANLNSYSYVLLPTALANPINPCQGVQTAFEQFNGQAANWGLIRIQVDLNVAYTGTGAQQQGSVSYSIDPGQIRTTGAPAGPQLLALPLALQSNSPNHDLPTLETPQPSDAPADPSQTTLIDLTGSTGALLNASALTPNQLNATLYPVALPAAQAFAGADQPAATATTTPSKAAPSPTATSSAQQQQVAAQLSLGAVEVDGNGRLIGMVGADSQGNHILYSVGDLQRAIGGVTGKSGQLMTYWKQGLDAFYATPPQYSAATSAFNALASGYTDFGGVQPFASAAAHGVGDIPSLTNPSSGGSSGSGGTGAPSASPSKLTLILIVAGALALALLLVTILALTRRRARKPAQALIPPEEAQLNLLPPDMPLDAVPEDDEPTRPISSIELKNALAAAGAAKASTTGAPSISDLATAHIPVAPRRTAAPRKTSILTAQSAGMIDPGIKRFNEPNQDNIFALEGVRADVGRLQPYSLFIVADGMGGHLNGQLASRLTIETVARTVAHTLNSSQPFDRSSLGQLLVEGVQLAHQEIQRRNKEQNSDMGTTITAALVVDDHAYIVNVGDSRTYLLNPDAGLRQITRDHSVVATLVASGVIRPEDIYIHPRRNQIYRSLGGDEAELEIDTFEEELQAGDKLLLCSDGLWEMVRDPQIANILRGAANPRQAAELLTREANANGGEDNIGVVVARMREGLPHDAQPGMRMIAGPQDAPPEGA